MKTTYILTGTRFNGNIQLTYENELLKAVELELKQPLTLGQHSRFFHEIQPEERFVFNYEKMGFKIEKAMPANKKVALFCQYYKQYKNGLSYTATRAEGNRIKEFVINDEILAGYFNSTNFLFKGKHSLSNLMKYYNELKAEIATAGKAQHPNNWNKEYASKLQNHELNEYHAHLRSLGLVAKKLRGITVDWVKPEHLPKQ